MKLLTPLQVGSVTVRNRAVSTAHGAFLDFYRPGVSGDQYVAYQERRARGGCGLIILQTMQVHISSQPSGHFMWEREDMLPKFRAMADALHGHQTPVIVQIGHFGSQFRSDGNEDLGPLWSFSPMLSPSGWETSHEMTEPEIEEVIDAFVRTAELAVEGGLDGVELHATHGYLIQQSFSGWGNRRQDRWGKEPLTFLDEIMARVRAAVGPDVVIGLRISAEDWIRPDAGGLGVEGLREVAGHACRSGLIDYLNHSEGARSAHYARAIADYYGRPGEFLPLTAGLRQVAAGVPVIAVGRILNAAQAESALEAGVCELVALTRGQIADPDLIAKTMAGQADRVRPCVGANVGCVDRMERSLPITCFHNPDVGRERTESNSRPDPRRVLVVGAGPAGLKAAEVAARRGHHVTVVDRQEQTGGRLRYVERLGPPAAMLGAIDWIVRELDELPVDLRLGTEADPGTLEAFRPEAIVLATGSTGAMFQGISDGTVDVLSIEQAMDLDPSDRRVVVVDLLGMQEQAFAAEYLARSGAKVTFVTPFPAVGPNIGFTHIRGHMERLYGLGVDVRAATAATEIADGAVTARHVFSRATDVIPADLLVMGGMRIPELALYEAAAAVCNQVLLAGDVVAPRSAMHAFREGDNAGRAVR